MVRKGSERGFRENGGVGIGYGRYSRQGKGGNLKLGSALENLGGRGSDDDDDGMLENGDFRGAIEAYDLARKDGVDLEQYHYAVVLYLCASAATGVVRTAKSGTGSRTLNSLELSDNSLAVETAGTVKSEHGNGEKVYYLLHKLRTSSWKVTPDTANLIEKWFSGPIASILGKIEWDVKEIKEAMEYGGGGWHGKDLDPVETEKFAQSVASIAIKREKNSFEKFQVPKPSGYIIMVLLKL
ncbi:hypothetical protein MLD38_005715 [Melastoma candidum]|uniref:Uncharacterized protein n=1 Tax=Melastoma candidum TaxID=119954 RepID=A0ACB9RPQ6_9MYRT|nr:hypothetical protein MLD38_005715 [Melastoma candidum]